MRFVLVELAAGGADARGERRVAPHRPLEDREAEIGEVAEPPVQQVLGRQPGDRRVVAVDLRQPQALTWSLRSTVGMPVRRMARALRGVDAREMIPSPSQFSSHGGAESWSERCSM